MANETMTLISTVTVGSGGAASIDFSSIPATYTDLCLVLSLRADDSSAIRLRFNSDSSTSNYTQRRLYGNGSSATSDSSTTSGYINPIAATNASWTANTFSNVMVYIPNYAGSTQKSVSVDSVNEANTTLAYQTITAALWNQTTAISSVNVLAFASGAGLFTQYSSASLYGVLKGSGGATVS